MEDVELAAFLNAYFERSHQQSIPGLKKYQKLLYFAQLMGWPSGFPFRMHLYGPYSAEADQTLELLDDGGAVFVSPSGDIRPTKFLAELSGSVEGPHPVEAIDRTIKAMADRPPKELELLGTIRYLWDAEKRVSTTPTQMTIAAKLKRLKPEKFTDEELDEAFAYLRELGLLPAE